MTDFLIIGGGIAGISTAAHLAALGHVTILEAENSLAYHASGRSAAMFLQDYGNSVVRALNDASVNHHFSANGGVLSARSMMMLGRPGEEEQLASEARAFGMERISVEEARQLVPIVNRETCSAAGFRENVYDLDTDKLVQDYLRQARAHGAVIETNARVDRIVRKDNAWQVSARGRTWSARILVNAAGAWADQIAEMAGVAPVGITPYRRSMARIPAPGGHDVSNWPFMDGVNERWYAKPDAGALIVSPSEEDAIAPQDAWADDMVLAEGLARYEEMMTEPVTRLIANWAGLRSFAPDRALVLGRDAKQPDFVWCAGQGGYGFQTAPAAARLISDILADRKPEIDPTHVAALSPGRFCR